MLLITNLKLNIFLADRTAVIGSWHDTVVCMSVPMYVCVCKTAMDS